MALTKSGYRLRPHGRGYVNYSGSSATKIKKGFNLSGVAIAAGAPITFDTLQDELKTEAPNVKAWTSTSQKIIGFACQPNIDVTPFINGDINTVTDLIQNNRPVAYIDSESISVISETPFTVAQYTHVHMRFSGTGTVGNIRNAAVAGQTVKLSGVKVASVDFYDGIYYARIEVTPSLHFVAD